MTFIDSLKEYLRRTASSPVWETNFPGRDANVTLYRKHLVEGLERLEQQKGPKEVENLHADWTDGERLTSFVRAFTTYYVRHFGGDETRLAFQDLVKAAIDAQLGLPLSGSLTWRLEIQKAADAAWTMSAITDQSWWAVEPYALEIRAVRIGEDLRITPTAIGRVALELTGIALVRWLLQVEVEQAMGPRDPWRLSRATATHLVARPQGIARRRESAGTLLTTLGRLYGMCVLDHFYEDESHTWSYAVSNAVIPVLEEIAGSAETPLRVLAATLLSDDRNAALAKAQPTLASLFGEEAAAASIRQARLVAHEVRNNLVPVQVALEGLFRALDHGAVDGIERYRGRIDDGVNRIFKFVDESLRVLTLAAEPAEAFDVSSALRDAVASLTTGEAEVTETIPAPGELPPVVGVRGRFVLAIGNVVRNAVQAAGDRKPRVAVAATVASDARSIIVTIDDDGPGVPAAQREAIFARGFSLRPGGTGLGLALTREVVERELGGSVTCTVSPSGGARFEITLPIIGKGAP